MTSKINITIIVKKHLSSLHNHGATLKTGERSLCKQDFFVFFVVPVIPALLFYSNSSIDINEVRSTIVAAFSIFTALLFSFLILCIDIIEKNREIPNVNVKEVASDLFYNISYEILISISIVLTILVNIVFDHNWKVYFDTFAIYLCTNFFLTILMILKRMHILIDEKNKL